MTLGRDRNELPAMPTELQLGGANAEVHVILHPLPEPVLMGCVNAGLHLILPSLHHLCVHSPQPDRSEEHTSELQSQSNIVCRLLLEKKKLVSPTSSFPSASGYRRRSEIAAR